MAKKNNELIRADPEFKKFVNDLRRFKSSQEKKDISTARITRAMFNQYKKYPDLIDEIKISKLGEFI